MATNEQIRRLLNGISEFPGCPDCGTRVRFGDFECPHCGTDLDDALREWAEHIIDDLAL